MKCQNCLKYFSGGHDYSRHLASCAGNPKQCPICFAWFMTRGQRDAHLAKKHEAQNPKLRRVRRGAISYWTPVSKPHREIIIQRNPRRTGAHGWPLVPSKRFPGELTLACPKCGSTDIVFTGAYGPGGRLGDPGGHDIVRCRSCKHQSMKPSRMNPRGVRAMAKRKVVYRRSGGGGGGGTNWGMIALVAGGAFLLMGGTRAFAGTGNTVTPQQLQAAGYQDVGGGYYRNPQTGQTIYRNPQTGQVQVTTQGSVPPGTSPWIAPLYQIGQAAIPAIGAGVATGISQLFKPSTWQGLFGGGGTPNVNEAMGGSMPTPGGIFGSESPDLPALPSVMPGEWDWMAGGGYDLGGGALPPLDEPAFDLGWGTEFDTSWLDSYQLPAFESGGVSMYSPDLPEYGWMTSLELAPVEPVYPDTSGWYSEGWF
jgi:hypothetical protein